MTSVPEMAAEFDTVAAWTADAVLELGPEFAIPAACRGSGTPTALHWLGTQLGISTGTPVLDVGAGLGGPSAFLVDQFQAAPVLVEPMTDACRAARRLFKAHVVAGRGDALPIAGATFPAAWSLGVLCTGRDKPAQLRELARILQPAGRLGLIVYLREVAQVSQPPKGNAFPTEAELVSLIDVEELRLSELRELDDFPSDPDWEGRAEQVAQHVHEVHGDDARWQEADDQQRHMARLLRRGEIRGVVGVAVRR